VHDEFYYKFFVATGPTGLRFKAAIMKVKRTATIAVVGGAFAAWLYAAATSGNRDRVDTLVMKPPAIDSRGAALAGEIARLHERLRPSATPRKPGRDLFSYVSPAPPLPAPVQVPQAAPFEAPAVQAQLGDVVEPAAGPDKVGAAFHIGA